MGGRGRLGRSKAGGVSGRLGRQNDTAFRGRRWAVTFSPLRGKRQAGICFGPRSSLAGSADTGIWKPVYVP